MVGCLPGYSHWRGGVSDSYAIGSVTGTSSVGGLVGSASSQITVTASYWDTESTGQSTSAVGTGKTTSELQSPTGYSGIYAAWNVDVDNADGDNNAATGVDDPWNFGARPC